MGLSRFSRVSRLGDSINEHISAQLDAEKKEETEEVTITRKQPTRSKNILKTEEEIVDTVEM